MATRGQVVPGDDEGEELLLRVAWYYHKDQMTQDDIAARLSVSRSSVSRMLEKARRNGIVTVQINSDHLNAVAASARLQERFGLREAIVVPDIPQSSADVATVNERVGVGGAQYLNTHLHSGHNLGVGFGDTISEVMVNTNFGSRNHIDVITLTGGVAAYLHHVAFARSSSRVDESQGHATATVIPSPILASTSALAAALRAEPAIAAGLATAARVDIAIIGIGTTREDATLMRMGYVDDRELAELPYKGAVGDILGVFYDRDGCPVDVGLHERRIGLQLDELVRIDTVVGVAGGMHKVPAITAALRGGYLDVLVTNEAVAYELLSENR